MKSVLPQVSQYSVLVAGSGSIGRRHMANLRRVGVQKLAAIDPDADRLQPMVDELGVVPFSDWEHALTAGKPDVVFICTPPVFHVAQAVEAVRHGAHVFIEKPLSDRLEGVDELVCESTKRQRIVQVGYNMRFHPGIRKLKQLLEAGAIGRVLWAHAEVGQYLPDWRPWQDYRQSYTARRELGGGIILDASHELDYVLWLLGQPAELVCMAGRVSRLEVNVEDCATVLLRFPSGVQADVHMDFVQPNYSRSCVLVGEQGRLSWDYNAHEICLVRPNRETEITACPCEPNQMYVAEVEDFFACVEQARAPNVGLAEARATLEVALAARRAAFEKTWVSFEPGN